MLRLLAFVLQLKVLRRHPQLDGLLVVLHNNMEQAVQLGVGQHAPYIQARNKALAASARLWGQLAACESFGQVCGASWRSARASARYVVPAGGLREPRPGMWGQLAVCESFDQVATNTTQGSFAFLYRAVLLLLETKLPVY
jgi:hypothetical protein